MKASMSELKEIGGFTWPGIEFGEPPSYKYSFLEVSHHLEYPSPPFQEGQGNARQT